MTRKVVDYEIVSVAVPGDYEAAEFILQVRKFISDGWQPIGGVVIAPSGERGVDKALQTMVRYEEEE